MIFHISFGGNKRTLVMNGSDKSSNIAIILILENIFFFINFLVRWNNTINLFLRETKYK